MFTIFQVWGQKLFLNWAPGPASRVLHNPKASSQMGYWLTENPFMYATGYVHRFVCVLLLYSYHHIINFVWYMISFFEAILNATGYLLPIDILDTHLPQCCRYPFLNGLIMCLDNGLSHIRGSKPLSKPMMSSHQRTNFIRKMIETNKFQLTALFKLPSVIWSSLCPVAIWVNTHVSPHFILPSYITYSIGWL